MIITLSQVKTYLGFTDSTHDSQISAMIPIIDAKVKQICRNNFSKPIYVKTVSGSDSVGIYIVERDSSDELYELMSGTMLSGAGIPEGAYIKETYYTYEDSYITPTFTMSANATQTREGYIYAGMNQAYLPTIAKGLWWLVEQNGTAFNDTAWSSRSVGPVSVTRSEADNAIDGKSGMPAWFVKALPRFHR